MGFQSVFTPLERSAVHEDAASRQAQGWRYVQMLAVNNEDDVDVVYSYMKYGALDNVVISALPKDAHLPSITDLYLEAFVCENEIHDLFGITFDGLAIDFLGNFYRVSTEFPMTITSPEKLAMMEKQRKLEEKKAQAEAAKAQKAKEAAKGKAAESPADISGATADGQLIDAEMEAKLAAMPPEKAAKVRAAMEAKARAAKKAAEGEDA